MSLSITPTLIKKAAERRGWTVHVIDDKAAGLLRLDVPDGTSYYIRGVTTYKSSSITSYISDRKDLIYTIAPSLGVPVPVTEWVTTPAAAVKFLHDHATVVIKPTDMSHGHGITVGVTTATQLTEAINYGRSFSSNILMQQQIVGHDYRLLFIGGSLRAATRREPATVIGDGQHTIRQLITAENDGQGRAEGYTSLLTHISEASAERYVGKKLDTVPTAGQTVQVVGVSNIGQGGRAIDVTDEVDPVLISMAQTLVDHFKMAVCGIDFMVTEDGSAYLLEINTGPSLGLHEYPYRGVARQTPDALLDMLVSD